MKPNAIPDAILDLTEDLPDDDTKGLRALKKGKRSSPKIKNNDAAPLGDLACLIADTAKALAVDPHELKNWLHQMPASGELQCHLLKLAKQFRLNPLLGQLDWDHDPEQGYAVFVTIDGWITLIHREPSFRGMSFHQSAELENGIPIWMECSLYRSDLICPISVREYFVELKTDHPIWAQMPRRMMRHKTLQQCVRLAFGIHVPEFNHHQPLAIADKQTKLTQTSPSMPPKQLLMEKLRAQSLCQSF